jgi:hypothetical protein
VAGSPAWVPSTSTVVLADPSPAVVAVTIANPKGWWAMALPSWSTLTVAGSLEDHVAVPGAASPSMGAPSMSTNLAASGSVSPTAIV